MIITDMNYLSSKQQGIPDEVISVVKGIVSDVKERGDEAVLEYTEKFDRVRIDRSELKVSWQEMRRAYNATPESLRSALKAASERIRASKRCSCRRTGRSRPRRVFVRGSSTTRFHRWGSTSQGKRGISVDGPYDGDAGEGSKGRQGGAVYAPGRDGRIPDSILAAAYLAEVDEVFKAGGAQRSPPWLMAQAP
jgi:histidinol dehydrogenase